MVQKRFGSLCGTPPDEPELTGEQARALARLMTNQMMQRESDRRRAVIGQSNINERLNKTNANVSAGIAHLSGQNISLARQIDGTQTQYEHLEAMIIALGGEVSEMKQVLIDADFIVIPPEERLHREGEVA